MVVMQPPDIDHHGGCIQRHSVPHGREVVKRHIRLRGINGDVEGMLMETFASTSFEEAITGLVFDAESGPRPGQQLEALLRAGYHLGHIESEEELLHAILNDAVSTLDAQRGAIVLADGPAGALRLR